MKHYIAVIALLLFLTELGPAQTTTNRELALTGSVLGVKEGGLIEIDSEGRIKRDPPNLVDIQLFLQFRNESATPIIIPLPRGRHIRKTVAFLEPSGATGDEVPAFTPVSDQYDNNSSELLRSLTADEPPKNLFVIIEPQAYYEFGDTVTVGIGYKLIETVVTGRYPTSRSITPKYAAFKVKYSFPTTNRSDVRDALLEARRKWAKFGNLVLTSNGSVELVSEIILNKPPGL